MTKTIKKHDGAEHEIKETLTDLKSRLMQRQRTLTYAAGGFILAIAVVVGTTIYVGSNKTKAVEKSAEGYSLFYGDNEAQFMSPGERYTKALESFKASTDARKSTYGLLYRANTSYELGDYDGTVKTLKELNGETSDPRLLSLSYYKMAMAYTMKQDFKNALNSLASITSLKGGVLQDLALLDMGKLSELTGKPAEAKKFYNDLVTKFPSSPVAEEAKSRMAKL